MVQKMFAWLAGLGLVMIFLVIISPDLFRGYVYTTDARSPGRKTYEVYCVGCHGEEGLGNGPASEFLNPKPRNFVNGDYKYFHFGEPGPLPSDESIKITIRNGLPGSSMPAFPLLTDQEIADVTTYIKSLREGGWEEQEPIQAAAEPVAIEGSTGEELFVSAACNSCHQHDPVGSVGGVGPNLTDVGSRLGQADLVQSIVEPNAVIAENCPAGPCIEGVMPQYFAERLTSEQIEALATFLAESK
jgi:mono/diheme cytochrome c family protein